MFCSNCGSENSESASFCNKCGQPIGSTTVPTKKKSKKVLWIIGSIIGLLIICCVAPATYGYVQIKNLPTATPTLPAIPTSTHIPPATEEAMPDQIVVNRADNDCAPVYHEAGGSAEDCIPNGTILHVQSNGPMGSSIRKLYWMIRWIDNNQLRFAGYIKRADVNPLNPGDPTPTPIPAGRWKTTIEKSSFDDTQTVALSLKADKPVVGWLDEKFLPVLILRCKEKKTEAYVNVGLLQTVESGRYNQSTVRLRFDSDESVSQITDQSTDNKALFFRDPQTMINQLQQHETLTFGFTPFNASPVETSFDLRGLNQAIQPLQEACK